MTARAISTVALLGLALVAAPSCTTNVNNYYYPGTGGTVLGADPTTGTIGQQGGSLRVTDPASPAFGSEISVPPDAVPMDTEISIAPQAAVDTPVASDNQEQAGPFIRFDPVDLQVASGHLLRITVPSPLNPTTGQLRLARLRKGSQSWEMVPNSGEAADGSVVGEVDGLGTFVAVIVGGGEPPVDTTPPTFAGLETVVAGPGVGQLTLSWQPATDETTATPQIVYYVWTSPASSDPDPTTTPVAITDPGALSIIVSGSDTTPQKYLVRARDQAGNFDANTQVVTFPATGGATGGSFGTGGTP